MTDAAVTLPPGAQLLGREWLGFDESGHVLIRFQAQPAFTNRHGTIQGGFLAAMLDSATGICALAALPPDQTAVTKSLDTRFLKPAGVGPITARAHVVERTDRDMVVQADLVEAAGVTVADATAKLRIGLEAAGATNGKGIATALPDERLLRRPGAKTSLP
ncbi:PaaI family thioesterase [Bradyrhizobium huanghuaihaiense]|uniref:PaaI family thioesterase n=1 Tax=Bradyrhizobium huanghuaihaiense TaxID=990078 RepID=UPI0024C01440|nr:PaaI family thioesterase [Bradyrhizobium huanghuaihaiense]